MCVCVWEVGRGGGRGIDQKMCTCMCVSVVVCIWSVCVSHYAGDDSIVQVQNATFGIASQWIPVCMQCTSY